MDMGTTLVLVTYGSIFMAMGILGLIFFDKATDEHLDTMNRIEMTLRQIREQTARNAEK